MLNRLVGICAVALGLIACGSNRALLVERAQTEAGHLRDYCKQAGLDNAETQRADALLASSAKHLKEGEEDAASAESDLAGTLYRLALARKELAEVQAQVAGLKQSLAKDRDQR